MYMDMYKNRGSLLHPTLLQKRRKKKPQKAPITFLNGLKTNFECLDRQNVIDHVPNELKHFICGYRSKFLISRHGMARTFDLTCLFC